MLEISVATRGMKLGAGVAVGKSRGRGSVREIVTVG